MKFVSKNSNLGVVLKPGFQGNAQLGTATVAGVYARFKDGVLETSDEWMIEKLQTHPGFNVDYIEVVDNVDPYANTRAQSEPFHVLADMKNGHPERTTKAPLIALTPEMKAAVLEMAKEMAKPIAQAQAIELAKGMLPSMMAEILKDAGVKNNEAEEEKVESEETQVAKKGGRPKKATE